jgi:type II secretory ATPase GspE/PulE/Tfp pilus assembly ATPase PilB-like protein
MWVSATDWVNRDAQIHKLGHMKWNAIVFFPFACFTLLLIFLPLASIIRAPILFVVFLGTWVPYVVVHNKSVEPHQTVLTGPWWRYAMANLVGRVGVKVSADRKAEHEKGAAVDLFAMGAKDANADNANLLQARTSPGYLLVKDLVVEMVDRRCERMLFDFTQQAVNVRIEIDGVWHSSGTRDRESSDVLLAVIKTLANLHAGERRKKQQGQFGAKYEGHGYLCPVSSKGVATGEQVVLSLRGEQQHFDSYAALGMREAIQKQWSELMASDLGVVVFSTMPGGGLTTITNVSLEETDRLMRDFVAIEEVNHREAEIQNIAVHTYDASADESPATLMPKLIRAYPDVYVCRDLVNIESVKLLINEVKDERLVVTNVRAKDSAEALLRILQMKVPAQEFAPVVKAVLYQRLVRLLCSDCKVSYTPPPDVLKKLGIPADKVEHLFRPPKTEEIEKPCLSCQGMGYKGRTGIFELLIVNDQIREILIKQPKLELLKKAARASRQRLLQEEGILLVAQGTTSIPELMRVLKQ